MNTHFTVCAGILIGAVASTSAIAGTKDPYYEPFASAYESEGGYREYVPVTSPRASACRRAYASVRDDGYRQIHMVECSGRNYTFHGVRDGRWWKVKVRARNGRIRQVYPL